MAKCIVQEAVTETIVRVLKPKTIVLELSEDEAHLILDIVGCALSNDNEIKDHCFNIYKVLQAKILPEHTYDGKYNKKIKGIKFA